MREDAIYRVVGALEADPQPLSAADAARLAAAAKMRAGLTGAKPRRWKLVLVAAAMLALAACAVVGFSSGWFASYTPPGDPQQANELLAEIGTPIGEKATAGDYTVTLLGAISDGYDLVVAFSVCGTGEAALAPQLTFAKNYLISEQRDNLLDEMEQAGAPQDPWFWYATQELRSETRYDEGETEQLFTARYELRMPADQGQPAAIVEGGNYHFALGSLTDGEGRVLEEGPWEFELTLSVTDQSRALSLDQTLAEDGIRLESLTVTPLNLILGFSGVGQPGMDAVRMEEGEEAFCWQKGTQQENSQMVGCSWGTLSRVIDPERVQAVQIDGVWYLLECGDEGCSLVREA